LPADFLLPLFAVTLLANAVLVAVAIRGMRRNRSDLDGPTSPTGRSGHSTPGPRVPAHPPRPTGHDGPLSAEVARAIAQRRALLDDGPSEAAPSPAPEAPVPSAPVETPAPEIPDPEARMPATPPPAATPAAPAIAPTRPKRGRPAGPTDPAVPAEPGPASRRPRARRPDETPRTGRRRFLLPPLDADHEKVSRSIETFLAGAEASPAGPASEAASTDPAASAGATTVALIALAGLPEAGRSAEPRPRGVESAAQDTEGEIPDALAMIERTLRGAARGTDVVSADGIGRYRILLPATGELAARAYLRRIRASVEPLLESADQPLRLVIATATVLDEPIAIADERAGHRLGVALDTVDGDGDADGSAGRPRTAGH
jgi:hypothetical protein